MEQQLKYIDGLVDYTNHSKARFVPHREKNFEILEVKNIGYPIDIFLDRVQVDSSRYPDEALARWYKKGGNATQVSYLAKVKVTRCKSVENKCDLVLPLDPYFAYWYVPKDKRVEMVYGNVKSVTTPCAYKSMAHLRNPSSYWNTWKPGAKDCKGLLKKNLHVGIFKARFIPENIERKKIEFPHLKNEIKISLISGLLHPISTDENLKMARRPTSSTLGPRLSSCHLSAGCHLARNRYPPSSSWVQ